MFLQCFYPGQILLLATWPKYRFSCGVSCQINYQDYLTSNILKYLPGLGIKYPIYLFLASNILSNMCQVLAGVRPAVRRRPRLSLLVLYPWRPVWAQTQLWRLWRWDPFKFNFIFIDSKKDFSWWLMLTGFYQVGSVTTRARFQGRRAAWQNKLFLNKVLR